jgi:NAD(P)-dependent dehydrogenase (short-subunit alcohol dehydrogenase family)
MMRLTSRLALTGPKLRAIDDFTENPRNGSKALNVASRALKREETPDDLVGALILLASHDSDFMTGRTLLVDGGSAMH